LFLIKNSSRFTRTEWLLAYTNSVKQYSATYYSIGGVLWKKAYQCKEKIAIKCAFLS
jgi:hypothetical protein